MTNRTRLFLGLSGSIAIATTVVATAATLAMPRYLPDEWFLLFWLTSVPMSILYLVVGLPAHFVLRRFGWRALWHYAAVGAAVGLFLAAFVELRVPRGHTSLLTSLPEIGTYGLVGVSCAALFWFLGVERSRPAKGPR